MVPSHCASSAFVQIGTKSRLVNCTFSFTQRITLYWDLDSRETQQWNHPSCRNNHVGKVTLERTSRREWHQEWHPMLVSQAICANEAGSFHRAERGRPQNHRSYWKIQWPPSHTHLHIIQKDIQLYLIQEVIYSYLSSGATQIQEQCGGVDVA